MSKVIILMASKGDVEHSEKIAKTLKELNVSYAMRIASAHKVPLRALEIVQEHDKEPIVFVTVAGRSNALSAFVDAATSRPVIACPPYSEKFAGADIYSSIRMPSGVCPLFVLEPEQAALAAAKILALSDKKIQDQVTKYQQKKRDELYKDDQDILKSQS